MNTQILLEVIMLSTMFLLTAVYFFRSKGSTANKVITFTIALLGAFLIMAGTAKFFHPFATMFAKQIEYSQLPWPALSSFAGQMGEITAGILYLIVLTENKWVSSKTASVMLSLASLLTLAIMSVAIFVHLSPNVPAEVLPLQSKPPIMTIIVMLIAFSVWLIKLNKQEALY